GGLYVNPAYRMTFTMQRFFLNAKLIYSELFYLGYMALNSRRVVVLWLFIAGVALWSRRADLRFLVWMAFLAPLPIMFLPWRGFFIMYFPMTAWAMFIAILLVMAKDRVI